MDNDNLPLVISGVLNGADGSAVPYEAVLTFELESLGALAGFESFFSTSFSGYVDFGTTRLFPAEGTEGAIQATDISSLGQDDLFSIGSLVGVPFFDAAGGAYQLLIVASGPDFIDAGGIDRDVSVADLSPEILAENPARLVPPEGFADTRLGTIDRFEFGEPRGPSLPPTVTQEEAQAIALLYETGLNRNGEIDLPGLNFWIDAREGSLPQQAAPFSIEEIAQFFLDSPEFEAAYGDPDALSDRALVEQLYLNVLDRPGETAGVEFWTSAVADPGFSRAELLYEFAVSVENAETLAFVETLTEVGPGEWAFV